MKRFYTALSLTCFFVCTLLQGRAEGMLMAPVAQDYEDFTYQDTPVSGTLAGQAFDPDGDEITYSLVTGSPNGTLVINSDGSYTYIPDPLAYGVEYMVYEACDEYGNCTTAEFVMYVIFLNDPPDPEDDYFYMEVNTTMNGNVSLNDVEPDAEVMVYSVIVGPAVGTLVMNSNGTFQYTPPVDFIGNVQFFYRACDPCTVCRNAYAYISVLSSNEPPVTLDYTNNEIDEDEVWSSSVASLATDPEEDDLTFSLVSAPAHGSVEMNADGSFVYSPEANYFGDDSFVYQVCDLVMQCDQAVVMVTILPLNDAPVAQDDAFTTNEDNTLINTVTANDVDYEPGVLTYTLLEDVDHGVLVWNDGAFTYTPALNYFGSDMLVYQVCDAQSLCDTGTVIITVQAVNDAPTGIDETANGIEDSGLNGNVANETDVEGGALIYSLIGSAANGSILFNVNGSFVYTPNTNWYGSEVINYSVCDPQNACDQSQLTIIIAPVNDSPVANDDPNEFTFENVDLNGDVSLNDTDADNDDLTYTTSDVALNGALTLNTNGTYTYVPDNGWNGVETFALTVCDDSSACDQSMLTIEVVSVNDGIIAQNGSAVINEDAVLNSSIAGLAFDADSDPIDFSVITNVLHGTLNLQANGSFTYTPNANYFGTDSFTFEACDPADACDQAVFTIHITSVNDAPVAVYDDLNTPEDFVLNNTVANDTDADGDALNYLLITNAMDGELTLNSNGTFSYAPDPNFFGVDMFTYQVCDGTTCDAIAAEIYVGEVNDIPVALDDEYNALSGVTINGNVSLNDWDNDGESLTYSIVTDASHGLFAMNSSGSFFYMSDDGYDGMDEVTVMACDVMMACGISTVTLNVSFGQTAPTAVADLYFALEDVQLTGNVATNDSDLQGGPLTYALISNVGTGALSFNSNGSFIYTGPNNYFGQQTFTYEVCDNTLLCSEAEVTINVQGVNDPPVAVSDYNYADEDVTVYGDVSLDDSDPDGDVLTYYVVTGALYADFTMNEDGTYEYLPDANFFGTEVITYEACDGQACTEAELFVEIGFINDEPVAVGEFFTMEMNTAVVNTASGNEIDLDDEPLLYYVVVQPLHGTVTMNSVTGNFVYTPFADYLGTDVLTYMACDPCGACAAATINFTIVNTNVAPVAENDDYSMNENDTQNGDLSLNDSDEDDDPLTYTLLSAPVLGVFTLNTDGSFMYIPFDNVFGTETLTYSVCDNSNECDEATITIEINSTNVAPVANDDTYFIYEAQILVSTVAGNDSDADNDALSYSVLVNVQNGMLLLNANGSFTYMPNDGFIGDDTFTYAVCDAEVCSEAQVFIQVFEINDIPTAVDDYFTTNDDDAISASVATNDLDAQGDLLSFYITTFPANGLIEMAEDGSFVYTPGLAFVGTDVMTYNVCDLTGCDEGMLTIEVLDGNETPVADEDYVYMNEDTSIPGSVATNDYDVDDTELIYVLNSTSTLGFMDFYSDGTFFFMPFAGLWGLEVLSYTVCDDDGACAQGQLTVEVFFVNDSPIAEADVDEVTEGETITGDVSINDYDEDGDALLFSLSSTPIHGVLDMNEDGEYTYTPYENFNGIELIYYSVCDWVSCTTGTLTITITAINTGPTVEGETENVLEDNDLEGDVSLNDTDPDGDVLLYTLVIGPTNGMIDLNLDGTYTYTPNAEYNGPEVIIYQACDELQVCVEATLEILVDFMNDIPVAVDDSLTIFQDVYYEGTVADNDIELDNEILEYELLEDQSNGLFEMFPDGSYTYTPNDGFIGTAYVWYNACDPCGACDAGMLTIIVEELIITNYTPVANSTSLVLCQGGSDTINMNDLISDVEEADAQLQLTFEPLASGIIDFNDLNNTLEFIGSAQDSEDVVITYTVCDTYEESLCASGTITIDIIPQNNIYITDLFVENVECYGEATGSIEIFSVEGAGNITYLWEDESTGTVLYDLAAGEYELTLTSDTICAVPAEFLITVSGPFSPLSAEATSVTGVSVGVDGAIDLTIGGGTAPYEVVWIGPGTFTAEAEDISELTEVGLYTAYITDLNGCYISLEVNITPVIELSSEISILLSPNPAMENTTLFVQSQNGELISYMVYDMNGRILLDSKNNAWSRHHREMIDMTGWAQGVYQVKVMAEGTSAVMKLVKQ